MPWLTTDPTLASKFNLHIIGRAKRGCEFNQKRCEFKNSPNYIIFWNTEIFSQRNFFSQRENLCEGKFKIFSNNKVISKVKRLGGRERPVLAYQGIKCLTGNELLQNEKTGTRTSFLIQFWWETEFHFLFPFSWAPPLLLRIFSLLLPVHLLQLLSNLVQMLSFNISYWDLIKFHYFVDTTETGVG